MLFDIGGGHAHGINLALGDALCQLVAHVPLEAAYDQALVPEVFLRVVLRVGNGGGVQHVHQAGKALGTAIVRGGRQQNQRVRAGGQEARQAGTLRTGVAVSHVVGLVDDDDVPVGLLEVVAVFDVLLERVDGNDRSVEVVERVVVGRNSGTDTLQAGGIQPDEWDREPIPHLLLELAQHRLGGEHEDPLAATTGDQFADKDAGFERLAQAD